MEIRKNKENAKLILAVAGRLDTTTAPMLETELDASTDGVTELVLDLEKLEYISSAGLRILLGAQKLMNKQGKMVICNVNEAVREVFDITGFSDILTIE